MAAIFFFLYRPPPEHHEKTTALEKFKRLDLVGLILFIASMICLIFGLQYGATSSSWNTPQIIVLFTLFGVFFLTFAAYETWLGESATLPPRIAKNRTVMSASLFVLCIDAPYYVVAYYVSHSVSSGCICVLNLKLSFLSISKRSGAFLPYSLVYERYPSWLRHFFYPCQQDFTSEKLVSSSQSSWHLL